MDRQKKTKRKIPIVMICDKNFVMQTSVAIESLYRNKAVTTEYEVYILLVDQEEEISNAFKFLERDGLQIQLIGVSLKRYQNIKQIAHVPLASLLKFDICDLIPQHDKLLYLDGDIIVRQDLCVLYDTELGDNYVAGVPHSLGIVTGDKKLNGGVLLLHAAKIRGEMLREVFVETRQSLGDRKSMDQETFHIVFGNKKVYLEPKYNVMIDKVDYEKKYYTMKQYNTFFGTAYQDRRALVDDAVIIHFTGSIKPWSYAFAACGKEWREYYHQLYGTQKVLPLKSKMDFYQEQIQKNGFKSLYWLLKDWALGILGEYLGIFPDKSHDQWN